VEEGGGTTIKTHCEKQGGIGGDLGLNQQEITARPSTMERYKEKQALRRRRRKSADRKEAEKKG